MASRSLLGKPVEKEFSLDSRKCNNFRPGFIGDEELVVFLFGPVRECYLRKELKDVFIREPFILPVSKRTVQKDVIQAIQEGYNYIRLSMLGNVILKEKLATVSKETDEVRYPTEPTSVLESRLNAMKRSFRKMYGVDYSSSANYKIEKEYDKLEDKLSRAKDKLKDVKESFDDIAEAIAAFRRLVQLSNQPNLTPQEKQEKINLYNDLNSDLFDTEIIFKPTQSGFDKFAQAFSESQQKFLEKQKKVEEIENEIKRLKMLKDLDIEISVLEYKIKLRSMSYHQPWFDINNNDHVLKMLEEFGIRKTKPIKRFDFS
jgi:archaellum component FlaC